MRRRLRGGIHFSASPGSKEPIVDASVPEKLRISIPYAPFKESLQIGDTVKAGQVLGYHKKNSSQRNRNYHIPVFASLPGRVEAITKDSNPSRSTGMTIVISVQTDDKPALPLNFPNQDLSELLIWTGLVSTVPKSRLVILNAVCDEPMISSPHRLLLEKTEEILSGVRIAMNVCSAERAWIVLDQRNTRLVRHMRRAISDKRMSIHPAKVRYPMSRDRLLSVVPEADPLDDPWVLTVHQALDFHVAGLGLPILDRVVSVSGDGVPKPINVRVKIGTPLNDIIAFCGVDPAESSFIVAGNPLNTPRFNGETPLSPEMIGIVVFHGHHALPFEKPCISCSRCRTICPAGLVPDILEKKVSRKPFDEVTRDNLRKCLRCGLCGFICPSKRNLFDRLCLARSSFLGSVVQG